MERKLLSTLGRLELDSAFRTNEPLVAMESSSPQEIAKHERWDRSNRLSLMYIQSHIAKGIRGSIVACFS
jgi:Asp/Glu/hydantoin racemase